jgi:hypothetical protein
MNASKPEQRALTVPDSPNDRHATLCRNGPSVVAGSPELDLIS